MRAYCVYTRPLPASKERDQGNKKYVENYNRKNKFLQRIE